MSNPNDQELKDAMLQVEGNALLNAVRQQQPAEPSGLVDPTGQPLGQTEEKPKVEMSPQALREMFARQVEERRMANAKIFSSLFEEAPKQAKVRDLMCLAHKMLVWCRMELAGHPDITDEMIEDLDYILQHQILSAKGFDFKTLVSQLKNYGVKTMMDFQAEYAAAGRVRKMQIDKIKKKLGDKGIPVTPDLQNILGKKFGPGMTVILRGDKESTRAALDHLLGMSQTVLDKVYLAQSEGCRETPFGHVVPMKPAWWTDAASKLSSLNAVFEPVTQAESLLLAVEDVDSLFTSDTNAHPMMRKSLAIKRMYQWSVENMVALILCDNDTTVVDHERPYGFIPFIQVSKTGKTLSIGKDTFDTEVTEC